MSKAQRKAQLPPDSLGAAGKQLWKSIATALELRPDELSILATAARTADQITALERVLAKSPVMIEGSKGQEVLNPLVPELRQQRALLASLLGRLDVPEAADEWDGLTSAQRARKAARARWG